MDFFAERRHYCDEGEKHMQDNNQSTQTQNQQPNPPKKQSRWYKKWWGILLIIFVFIPLFFTVFIIAFAIASYDDDSATDFQESTDSQSYEQSEEQRIKDEAEAKALTKQLIEGYVPAYCQSHQQKRIPLPYAEGDSWKYNTENPTVGVSEQDCRNVITYLVDNVESSAPSLEQISKAEISVGMNRHELLMSWGVPNDVNTTTVAGGTSAQWIYGDPIYGANYVYLDNDVVTAIQNN